MSDDEPLELRVVRDSAATALSRPPWPLLAQDVTAVLVTRGDVDMQPIIDTLPYGEVVVWDNSVEEDWGLFGRYMGQLRATRNVIYVQDDDCLVRNHDELLAAYRPGRVTANFRPDPARMKTFHDSALMGWGALYDRGIPWAAFARLAALGHLRNVDMRGLLAEWAIPMFTPTTKLLQEPEWLHEGGQPVYARSNRMSQDPGFYDDVDDTLALLRRLRDILGLPVDALVLE